MDVKPIDRTAKSCPVEDSIDPDIPVHEAIDGDSIAPSPKVKVQFFDRTRRSCPVEDSIDPDTPVHEAIDQGE